MPEGDILAVSKRSSDNKAPRDLSEPSALDNERLREALGLVRRENERKEKRIQELEASLAQASDDLGEAVAMRDHNDRVARDAQADASRLRELSVTPDEAILIADAYFDGDPVKLDKAGEVITRLAEAANRALNKDRYGA